MIFLRISLLTIAATLQMSHGGDRDELLMQMLRDHGRDCGCTNGLESMNEIKPQTPSCASQPVVPGPLPTPSTPGPPESVPQQPKIPQPPGSPESVPQQPTISRPSAPPRPPSPQPAPHGPTHADPDENEIKPISTTRPPPRVICKNRKTNGSPFHADSFTNSKRLLPLFEGTPNCTRLMEVPKFNLQEHKDFFNKEYGVTRLTFKWPGHRLTFTYYGYFGLLDAVAKDDLKDVTFYAASLMAKKITKRSFFFFDMAVSKFLCPKWCVNPNELSRFPSSESCRTRMHETKYVERLEEEIETHQITRNFLFLFPGNELTITYYGQDGLHGCSLAEKIWDVGNYSFDNIQHKILISD